jgi:hypothetical protein
LETSSPRNTDSRIPTIAFSEIPASIDCRQRYCALKTFVSGVAWMIPVQSVCPSRRRSITWSNQRRTSVRHCGSPSEYAAHIVSSPQPSARPYERPQPGCWST